MGSVVIPFSHSPRILHRHGLFERHSAAAFVALARGTAAWNCLSHSDNGGPTGTITCAGTAGIGRGAARKSENMWRERAKTLLPAYSRLELGGKLKKETHKKQYNVPSPGLVVG